MADLFDKRIARAIFLSLWALYAWIGPGMSAINVNSISRIGLAFSIVERVCRNVKRWHDGDQRERWVGSGLLVAEKQFRRIQGYKQIPNLLRELESLAPSKEVVKRKKAS